MAEYRPAVELLRTSTLRVVLYSDGGVSITTFRPKAATVHIFRHELQAVLDTINALDSERSRTIRNQIERIHELLADIADLTVR